MSRTDATTDANDSCVHAAYLREHGFALCLIDPKEKKPTYSRWGTFSKEPDDFGSDSSIGIIGGPISAPPGYALMMVDLDNEEVVKWGDAFLPATGMIDGRPGKPNSHWYYYVPFESVPESAYSTAEQSATHAKAEYGWPGPKIIHYSDAAGDGVIDFIGTGGQVVCPPSSHPLGERRAWVGGVPGIPAIVEYPVLLEAVERLAAHGGWVRPKANDPPPPAESNHASANRLFVNDTSLPYNRAKAYLATMPASISHSNGDKKLYTAACRMWNGFALSEDDTYRLLVDEFNPRCEPPWPENRVRYKVSQAAKAKHKYPRGYLLNTKLPDHDVTDPGTTEEDEAKAEDFDFIDSQEFDAGNYQSEFFITGVLTKGEPFGVIGLSKVLKTSITVDAFISMATGLPFLGTFKVPKPINVAFMSAESGKRTLQETARRICLSKGTSLGAIPRGRLSWCFKVPILTDLPALAKLGTKLVNKGVEAIAIDPMYLTLGDVDARNLFEVGKVLANVGRLLSDQGLTVGFLHHANRKALPGQGRKAEPLELTDIAYSGLEQYVRQWFLLSRREKYQQDGNHKLFFKYGGSSGHGGLHELDIYEGVTDEHFQGRVWNVTITQWAEAKAAAADERDEKKKEAKRLKAERYKKDVLEAIDKLVADNRPTTTNALRVKTGHSDRIVKDAIEALRQADVIVATTLDVKRSNFSKAETVYIRKPVQQEVPILFPGESGSSVQNSTSVQNDEMDGGTDASGSILSASVHTPPLKGEGDTDGRMIRVDKPHKNGKPKKSKSVRMQSGKRKKEANHDLVLPKHPSGAEIVLLANLENRGPENLQGLKEYAAHKSHLHEMLTRLAGWGLIEESDGYYSAVVNATDKAEALVRTASADTVALSRCVAK